MKAKLEEKRKVHRAYTLATELTKFWNENTSDFDAYLFGEPEIHQNKLHGLVLSVREMQTRCSAVVKELKALKDYRDPDE